MAPEPKQNFQMFQMIKNLQVSSVQFKKNDICKTPKKLMRVVSLLLQTYFIKLQFFFSILT